MTGGTSRPERVRRTLALLQITSAIAAVLVLGFLLLLQQQDAALGQRFQDHHLRSVILCGQISSEASEVERLLIAAPALRSAATGTTATEIEPPPELTARSRIALELIQEAVDELEALDERFGPEFGSILQRLRKAISETDLTSALGGRRSGRLERSQIHSVLVASKQLAALHIVAGKRHLKEGAAHRRRTLGLGLLLLAALLSLASYYSLHLHRSVRTLVAEQDRANQALEENRDQLEQMILLRSNELEEVSRSRELHQRLAARLQEAREEERAQVAREIHDEFGQALTGVKMDISWLLAKKRAGEHPPWLFERLCAIQEILDKSLQYVRALSWRLRPPLLDDLGLAATIEWQIGEFERQSGCKTELLIDIPDLEPAKDRDVALFRIVQEALTNVMRHASASNVAVSLRTVGDELLLEIEDDGVGLASGTATDAGSLGLHGMVERAQASGAKVEFLEPEKGGTLVSLSMPYKPFRGASASRP